ncbi:Glutamine transport ATP-binding protein GlnQ [compost metagenome]
MPCLLKAVGLNKHYNRFPALRDVHLDVRHGEVLCLVGPSGSGKSTLLRCINQLETVDSGGLWLDGERLGYRVAGNKLYELTDANIARQRRAIGMVAQRFNLFPHMTVLDNIIEGPCQVLKQPYQHAREQALALLAQVGLSDKPASYPAELSTGQQQRVAIARALAMQPKLMLFDEPTSALDPERVGEVLAVMRNLAQAGMSMIVVTHELGFARELCDRAVFMENGRIEAMGSPEELLIKPRNPRLQRFIHALGS